MSALVSPDKIHYDPTTYVGYCTPTEAHNKHVPQLSSSGCGATAVVNSLLLLGAIDKDSLRKVDHSCCILRTRANEAPLPQYLKSRYNAGCTGEELVESMRKLLVKNRSILAPGVANEIESEFVSFRDILLYEEERQKQLGNGGLRGGNRGHSGSRSAVSNNSDKTSTTTTTDDSDNDIQGGMSKSEQQHLLAEYLSSRFQEHWLAIATMNLQVIGNDAWHHQIVYGLDRSAGDSGPSASAAGNNSGGLLYLLNPYETCTLSEVVDYMSTESVLLIKQEDVLSRVKRIGADLSIYEIDLWRPYHVAEQVAEMVAAAGTDEGGNFPFVIIPAAYVPGFAFFRRRK